MILQGYVILSSIGFIIAIGLIIAKGELKGTLPLIPIVIAISWLAIFTVKLI